MEINIMQTAKIKQLPDSEVSRIVRESAINFTGEKSDLDPLLDLVGDSSFVLIGEATHGTHEFYKTRIDITKRLIEEKGFNVVAAEADWPDAWMVNRFVKNVGSSTNAKIGRASCRERV